MFILALVLAIFAGSFETAKASSADISLSVDTQSVEVGDRLTLYLSINADILPGNFECFISYDCEVFEYIAGPEFVSGGEGLLKLSDTPSTSESNYRKYALSFKAAGRGTCEFGIQGSPELYEFEEGYLMSVAANSVEVTVSAPYTAPSDATLADLRVSPGSLIPEFGQTIMEYTVAVDNSTDKLIISAHPTELSSKVTIEGNSELSVGQNRIVITVTAESGDEKKYVIYCVREEAAAEAVTPTPATVLDESSGTPGLKVVDGVTYIYGKFDFEVCSIPEGFSMPEGYQATSVVMNGQAVTAYVNSDQPDGDFIIMVLKNHDGEPGLYCYDRVEKTIQRYESGSLTSRIDIEKKIEQSDLDRAQMEEYESKISTLTLIVIILCAVCAMLMVFVIRLFLTRRHESGDELR